MSSSGSETGSFKVNDKGTFLVPPLPPPSQYNGIAHNVASFTDSDERCRLYSSSNESQLDDSLINENCCSIRTDLNNSGSFHHRNATRSLSCSPMSTSYKLNNESEIVFLQNEKFKEKFPKACKQMEENLASFIENNKENYFNEPIESFIHNQIIVLANLCLKKSRENQLTCAYFDEMTNSLEKLLVEAPEKCVNVDSSVDSLRKFVKKFLLIVSRVARLLECLEFDPEEFCHLLNAAEAQARHVFINYTDIPKYIISKLGLNKRDPFEEFSASINAETNCDSISNVINSTNMITKSTAETTTINSMISSQDILVNTNNINNNNNSGQNSMKQKDGPKEEDFEQIKLISNGAYGAVYLVRYTQSKDEKQRFAMKKIKKDNLILSYAKLYKKNVNI
jgi:microtubule-associated serine/threonine kinase